MLLETISNSGMLKYQTRPNIQLKTMMILGSDNDPTQMNIFPIEQLHEIQVFKSDTSLFNRLEDINLNNLC